MAASLHPPFAFLHQAGRPQPRFVPLQSFPYRKPAMWLHYNPLGVALPLKMKPPSRRACIRGSTRTNDASHEVPSSPSPSTAIRKFYDCINSKNHSQNELDKFISYNCFFEDLAFTSPFRGRKEVHHFLRDLREAMGKHITFAIERVYQGENSAVAVLWHLEWNQEAIPFTKGCSLFECSRNGDEILIERARIFVESPVKPGDFVLELLKIISSIFDRFPNLAKWFLEKPHAILQFMMKIYRTFLEPLILPLLVYYTNAWRYAAQLLSCFLNALLSLLKIFM